jgi:hypothetical protein
MTDHGRQWDVMPLFSAQRKSYKHSVVTPVPFLPYEIQVLTNPYTAQMWYCVTCVVPHPRKHCRAIDEDQIKMSRLQWCSSSRSSPQSSLWRGSMSCCINGMPTSTPMWNISNGLYSLDQNSLWMGFILASLINKRIHVHTSSIIQIIFIWIIGSILCMFWRSSVVPLLLLLFYPWNQELFHSIAFSMWLKKKTADISLMPHTKSEAASLYIHSSKNLSWSHIFFPWWTPWDFNLPLLPVTFS